jgi:CRISPR-associated protein Cst1
LGQTTRKEWETVVRRGYLYAKETDSEEKIANYSNRVYENLLAGRSISRFFVVIKEHRPAVRGHAGWLLYSSYLKEVKGVEQRRLDSLRDLGDRLAPLVREKRRRLLAFERAKSKGELTGVLYRLAKDALTTQEEPLITFEQLVSDVFPHDMAYSDWREVKYLLLFRIYEQLHDVLKEDNEYLEAEDPDADDLEEVEI